ncbi:CSAD decarboxylase, partial [Calyptomena viridis]|nr:CSAD decarboxylase [Calyptomena viridis]
LDQPGLDNAAGEEFLREVLQVLLEEGVRKGTDVTQKVCDWKEPQELRDLLDLELRDEGEGPERLLQRCRDVLRFSVRTGERPVQTIPEGIFGVSGGFGVPGQVWGDPWPPRYTYEVAPVLVLLEQQVLAKLRQLVGWSSGDGIFAPGGSMSNMLAMNVARFRRFPESRSRGSWDLPRLALFASQESHYSILKGAAFLGIGTDNVHLVPTDERGKMIPEELEKEIQRVKAEVGGLHPPGGTTVLGAFDPLVPIAEICARHGLWLHVDAAWGGSALLAPKLRHLLDGIHRWDPPTPEGCDPPRGFGDPPFPRGPPDPPFGLLQRCHGVGAPYLFQKDKFYPPGLDPGDKSPQCGRPPSGLKLWLLWKALGSLGLGSRVERAFAATRYLLEQVKSREGFRLVVEPEFLNICFWFIPPSLRGQEETPEFWDKLGKVAPVLKERMIRGGSLMLGYQPQGSRVNFFRGVVTSPAVTCQDLRFLLDHIQELGQDL